ncbi:MAG: NifB/NifX family molybdenum-iron cluster-binding protein [Deltaproteobacteria bacterium]|jgi:predicted Fe-Mo cluster-binding NifX family protein|nr:NifB/NifX family molybdenum-iron cluster-binding protein [Deltaproteobacteria bacterium]
MIILITAAENKLEAEVDPRFGRSKWFALYETDDDSAEFVSNEQNLNAPSGAGVQAGANAAKTGAKVVITGNCGPKAFRALDAAGIKVVIGASGTVREAAEKFKNGECKYATDANVEGHW